MKMATSIFFISRFFFFNDTATTEIYTLSLHDALPIFPELQPVSPPFGGAKHHVGSHGDRKSTRLNSSHTVISYAVFCLKKKKNSWVLLKTKTNKKKTKNQYSLQKN